MAENKKSFILYCDQKGVWDKLDDGQAGKLIKHIISYVNDENPKAPDFITELAFEPIKQQLKRDLLKWADIKVERSESGKLGGIKSGEARRIRKQTEANEANASKPKQTEANEAVNVNESVNVTVNVNDNVNVSERIARNFSWFKSLFDEMYLEQLKMTHKGKDIQQAILESYAHLAADKIRLNRSDQSDCKRLLNTWLSNQKQNKTTNGIQQITAKQSNRNAIIAAKYGPEASG